MLEQLFGLPSDDESVDGMEESDDDTNDITATTSANETAADDMSQSESDDDDDILYESVDPNADVDWSDEDSDTDGESNSIQRQTVKKLSGIKIHLWRATLIWTI